jgi:hypothetical protein
MTVTWGSAWGNTEAHSEAFRDALEEFYRQNPEEHRRFHEIGYELQRVILARQVELYNERKPAPAAAVVA